MHPYTRKDRRYLRECFIASRKFIARNIWNRWGSIQDEFIAAISNPLISLDYLIERYKTESRLDNFQYWLVDYGRYNKWNLNCTCRVCRVRKVNSTNHKQRVALKTADKDWEQDLDN